ncbi:putative ring-like domain-containing protein [Eutypa lata UCREL1]|uniref:Putative ring-like domain-containing protein n=1 Tax=Eutypa lata (strain UCR-EL1) TaxID=1287681 RepID=M7SGL6_EUTLA|nr:putative ring-like domain-containing protein [Eutypa lata UCREL1]
MLEYFTFKKVKKHRAEKAEKERLEKENNEQENTSGKGKDGASSNQEDVVDTAEKKTDTPTSPPATSSPAPVIISKSDETPKDTPPSPVLQDEDERFLERLTSSPESSTPNDGDDDETPPPLPPRIKTPVIEWDSDASSIGGKQEPVVEDGKGKEKEKDKKKGKGKEKEKNKSATTDTAEEHKAKRFSFVTNLGRGISLRKKPGHSHGHGDTSSPSTLKPTTAATAGGAVSENEERKEEAEIARVLDDLDLAVGDSDDKKAFSLSRETSDLVRRFTQVLKDLASGVPTAYGDLVQLIEDRDGVIERTYNKLPKGLQKLVTKLPDQLSSKLGPELLAVAAEAQGLSAAEGAADAGLKGAAKRFLTPSNLQELVTKPGAVAGLLKGIVNALKARWPAFIGTNVLWSVAVFLLLSVLWYCYKRGREVRLESEASEKVAAATEVIDESARVEELPDDPQLPGPSSPGVVAGAVPFSTRPEGAEENEHVKVFPPPTREAAATPTEAAVAAATVGK